MAYIKINDGSQTVFFLNDSPEESFGGTEYWYLKISILCNLTAEELSEIFVPENLSLIKMFDNQDQEVDFSGYTKIISVRRTYDKDNLNVRVAHIVLQKKLEIESEATTNVINQ